jgi:ubiquinone/menaquinone biosynthesis C-methylase UbiE
MNDFSALNFERLWKGRGNVTDVENQIILSLIHNETNTVAIELGAGNGRIAKALYRRFSRYYALDHITAFLESIDSAKTTGILIRITGDLYRIPARDDSVDVALMVRVFNFLDDPQSAMDEIYRVIRPGGVAVISYFHRYSISEFMDILLSGECHTKGADRISQRRRVLRSNFTEFFYPRSLFAEMAINSGFTIEEIKASGIEDYRPFKFLPAKVFVELSGILAHNILVPHTFVKLRKHGRLSDENSRNCNVLACPECHESLDLQIIQYNGSYECRTCRHKLYYRDGILIS